MVARHDSSDARSRDRSPTVAVPHPQGPRRIERIPRRAARPLPGFHGAVSDFKRRLIEATLTQAGGNRTRAARALGLQRTYLLRLIRDFEIRVPPAPLPGRRAEAGGSAAAGAAPAQTR